MRGTYLKNGEVTEVIIGNGLTEILPPVDVRHADVDALFYFMPRPERKRKSTAHRVAIFASVVLPYLAALAFTGACEIIYVMALVWSAIVILANILERGSK